MQQICHQLRTHGSMDFEEISEVIPFVELAHDLGHDLTQPQVAEPRIFKTHCWYDHCPKGAKYILVLRNPEDVALSFFKFFEGWYFQPGEISLEVFLREFWLQRGIPASRMQNASYHHHLLSWYAHRLDPNVLTVFYEDMKADLEGTVRRVARFLQLDASQATLAVAVEHSSFEFMKAHATQFDEHVTKRKRNPACGLPLDAGMGGGKVNQGTVGGAKALLPEHLQAEIHAKWRDTVERELGFPDYEAFRQSLTAELREHQRW